MKFQYINILGGHPDLAKHWRGYSHLAKCQEGTQIWPWKDPKYPHNHPSPLNKDFWASVRNDNDVHCKFHIPSFMEIKGCHLLFNWSECWQVKWKNYTKQNHVLENKIVQLTCQSLAPFDISKRCHRRTLLSRAKLTQKNYKMISLKIALHPLAAQKSIVEKYYGEIWWGNVT